MKNLVIGVALLASTALADVPGRHPAYLHARSDLRRADQLLLARDEPNVMRDLQVADEAVRRAIGEIDRASVIDRKSLDSNPPVDVRMDRPGRMRETFRLLQSAKNDITREEDNPYAMEWRNRAIHHIDEALGFLRKAAQDRRWDYFEDGGAGNGPGPERREGFEGGAGPRSGEYRGAGRARYLHALSDLRYARALLYRRDSPDVMMEQRRAIEEIDRAIFETKEAAIDDGRNLDDHPPIDANFGWGDRFRKAIDALTAALDNLRYEEDNRDAAAWRGRAAEHVRIAIDFARRSMEDKRRDQ